MNSSDITAMVIIPAMLAATVVIIMVILNHRIKVKMISAGLVNETSTKLLSSGLNDFRFNTLKWGLILLFGGIGLILLQYIPYPDNSTLPFGIEAVCLALGFLTYYFMMRNTELQKGNAYSKVD